jgi:asparagine synthase (glutamine-hydrolysing)
MCGISGQISLTSDPVPNLRPGLVAMSQLLAHRGPDGHGLWQSSNDRVGLVHRRLAIIDLSESASQPMRGVNGSVISFNGEIYNYPELRDTLSDRWTFHSHSDTECILAAYDRYEEKCLNHLRGMFAFAIWDERKQRLFCARDRFGIKPLYYCQQGDILYFSSEAKALVPFLHEILTDKTALAEYLTFQYTIGEKTLFSGIRQLLPAHALVVENGKIKIWRYWDVQYQIDFDHSPQYFHKRLHELLHESVSLHGRSDVSVGAYVSGGVDSSLIYLLNQANRAGSPKGFHGRVVEYTGYDESEYAKAVMSMAAGDFYCIDINAVDFREHIANVIYHLDFPVAGPGAFPQFMVSKLAAEHLKVVMGGQGGDEIFGGYARYVIAYFEQCIKAAIDGQYGNGNYVVTMESIVPNLGLLREYKPLMKEFWRDGMFDSMDARYFRLVNRATDMNDEIDWKELNMSAVFESFQTIFNNPNNVAKEAYFDKMTHFDFKCLLPALLQVEDRMSMAHGLESRVPFLDHPLVEFLATVPADVKFKGGNMKHLIKQVFRDVLPVEILNRRDKMGFPIPLKEWFDHELKDFVSDIFSTMANRSRPYLNGEAMLRNLNNTARFSRKSWGLLSLELWHQQFHDRATEWRRKASDGVDF